MSINIGPPVVDELRPKISVIGVGGAGGNAVGNMIDAKVDGVDFIVANTDAQALNSSAAEQRIQLGGDITQGLGAGSRPEVGRAAAEETIDQIKAAIERQYISNFVVTHDGNMKCISGRKRFWRFDVLNMLCCLPNVF